LWRRPRPKLGCGAKEGRININRYIRDNGILENRREWEREDGFSKVL
jgi:hypothetical protein